VELVSDFKTYLSSLEPTDVHVAAAKAAHEKVREILGTDGESKSAHKTSFLSGSYARSTAINDINDVDVIWVVDMDTTITPPTVVLSWLHSILARHYKETRAQGRSVGANAAKNVWLDIVPAAPLYADDGPLWIPDRDAQEWVQTHPKGQIAAGLEKNKTTNGYYVQVVKLLKAWRDRLPTESARPKSYILETLVHKTLGLPTSHAAAVVSVLEGIENNYGAYRQLKVVPNISDPGYSPVNVAKRWSVTDFDAFMAQVSTAADTARGAYEASDEATSRRLWRHLFGSDFGK
jgi:Second Messenger Oligonucleotide or Dinucleotide Synthetase domain